MPLLSKRFQSANPDPKSGPDWSQKLDKRIKSHDLMILAEYAAFRPAVQEISVLKAFPAWRNGLRENRQSSSSSRTLSSILGLNTPSYAAASLELWRNSGRFCPESRVLGERMERHVAALIILRLV
jgi:hypothetical protein